ncbi:hypothetical protein NKH18_26335 [Streptomyces sp. M10(2022)]
MSKKSKKDVSRSGGTGLATGAAARTDSGDADGSVSRRRLLGGVGRQARPVWCWARRAAPAVMPRPVPRRRPR